MGNVLTLSPRPQFIKQLIKFGIVGVSTVIANFVTVIILVSLFKLHPLVANIVGFVVAFQVSFYGHHFWTFPRNGNKLRLAMKKYFMVAIGSFFLNEALYALLLSKLQLHYIPALILVLVTIPPISFVFSKLWVFKGES